MARTTFLNVREGGSGSVGPHYYQASDTTAVSEQDGFEGLGYLNVIVNISIEGVAASQEVTARVAMDNRGEVLGDDDHLLALPCPPYCGKGLKS